MNRAVRAVHGQPGRPRSAPLHGRRPAGRPTAPVGRPNTDSQDGSQFAEFSRSVSQHVNVLDGSTEERAMRMCENEKQKSPSSSTSPRQRPQRPQRAPNRRRPEDTEATLPRAGGYDSDRLDETHLWAMKQDLFESFRADLLELGKAVVGTLKHELQQHADSLRAEFRAAIGGLANDLKALQEKDFNSILEALDRRSVSASAAIDISQMLDEVAQLKSNSISTTSMEAIRNAVQDGLQAANLPLVLEETRKFDAMFCDVDMPAMQDSVNKGREECELLRREMKEMATVPLQAPSQNPWSLYLPVVFESVNASRAEIANLRRDLQTMAAGDLGRSRSSESLPMV